MMATDFYTYHSAYLDKLIKLNNAELQQYVRFSFASLPSAGMTKNMSFFISSVVKPVLKVNVANVNSILANVAAQYTRALCAGGLSDQERLSLKIAAASVSGELDNHPLIQGLAVLCLRKVRKEARHVEVGRGRPVQSTQLEDQVVADAGLTISLSGANSQLAKEFGMTSLRRFKFDFDNLMGIPSSPLALVFPERLRDNMELIDQILVRANHVPQRSLRLIWILTGWGKADHGVSRVDNVYSIYNTIIHYIIISIIFICYLKK